MPSSGSTMTEDTHLAGRRKYDSWSDMLGNVRWTRRLHLFLCHYSCREAGVTSSRWRPAYSGADGWSSPGGWVVLSCTCNTHRVAVVLTSWVNWSINKSSAVPSAISSYNYCYYYYYYYYQHVDETRFKVAGTVQHLVALDASMVFSVRQLPSSMAY